MIFVNVEFTNTIVYKSRYNTIDYYEIFDHDSRLVTSGTTNLTAVDGQITHYLYYYFVDNELYTYKAYSNGNLSSQQLLSTYQDDYRLDGFKTITKDVGIFKTKDSLTSTGYTTSLSYYTRYDKVDKFEVLDHNSRIVYSGLTTLNAVDGQIIHTGITLNLMFNDTYTYKSYSLISGIYKLSTQQLIKTDVSSYRNNSFKTIDKENTLFKNLKVKTLSITIIDGGSATYVSDYIIDGGSATFVGSENVDGNYL